MISLLCFVMAVLAAPFKSKSRLEAENAALRDQLIVLRRKRQGRVRLTNSDRWFFIQLYRWFPSILNVLAIVRPETLVHWHRAGFRCYWRWKSCPQGGRPQIDGDLAVRSRCRRQVRDGASEAQGLPLAKYNLGVMFRVFGQRCTGLAPHSTNRIINSHAILGGLHHHYVRV